MSRVSSTLTISCPSSAGKFSSYALTKKRPCKLLAQLRSEGNTIALVTHARSAGKTVTAIADARRLAKRTLFVAHTQPLVNQAQLEFQKHWPEVETGLFLDERHEVDAFNVAGTVQSVARYLDQFAPDAFGYVIIDEAHHATGETYQKLLRYFRPQFTLGLTATPDRADGTSALEVFQNAAHRLSLRDAIEKGELVPIRCVRVRTNVDLTRVRFNQVQYYRRDIEEAVRVPSRDHLILETYQTHVPGRKAVIFCVNVRHAEDLALLFRQAGLLAQRIWKDTHSGEENMSRRILSWPGTGAMRLRLTERGMELPRHRGTHDGQAYLVEGHLSATARSGNP